MKNYVIPAVTKIMVLPQYFKFFNSTRRRPIIKSVKLSESGMSHNIAMKIFTPNNVIWIELPGLLFFPISREI